MIIFPVLNIFHIYVNNLKQMESNWLIHLCQETAVGFIKVFKQSDLLLNVIQSAPAWPLVSVIVWKIALACRGQ